MVHLAVRPVIWGKLPSPDQQHAKSVQLDIQQNLAIVLLVRWESTHQTLVALPVSHVRIIKFLYPPGQQHVEIVQVECTPTTNNSVCIVHFAVAAVIRNLALCYSCQMPAIAPE